MVGCGGYWAVAVVGMVAGDTEEVASGADLQPSSSTKTIEGETRRAIRRTKDCLRTEALYSTTGTKARDIRLLHFARKSNDSPNRAP